MEPKIVEKPEMILVGIVGCGSGVRDIDIHGLWQRFEKQSKDIKHGVEGKGYEVHIEEDAEPKMHFCLTGIEARKIEDIPTEMFVKVLPACTYALFTHQFKDGDYGQAFQTAYDWLNNSEYTNAYPFDIQCYDARFKGPNNPESELDIYIPIKSK